MRQQHQKGNYTVKTDKTIAPWPTGTRTQEIHSEFQVIFYPTHNLNSQKQIHHILKIKEDNNVKKQKKKMRVRKRDRYIEVKRWKTLLSITYSILFSQMNSKVCTWEKQKMKVEDIPSDHTPQPAGTPVTTASLLVALLPLSKVSQVKQ